MDEGIPKQIGRYSIDRLLGSGAMGFVFLGRDPELDRPVAVKTVRDLKMDPGAMDTFLERFRNEARAAARLHHPNIVQVYDVGEEEELGPYLVFEYVAGSTLKQQLKSKGPLEPAQVVRLAEEIGDALTLAHDHQIIHRDIKPDNLLMTPDGQTKLADFGVARMPNASLTREGQFLGTPCYAAPETLSKGSYGPHSDLFSFAAVLYEAASGERAFPGQDAVAVAHKVIHDEPLPVREVARDPSRVPKAVEGLIMMGLSKNPDDRMPSARDFSDAIREAYEVAGLVEPADITRPPSRRVPVGVEPKESRSGLAFAMVLLAVAVIGIGVVVLNSDSGAIDALDAEVPSVDAAVVQPMLDAAPDVRDANTTDVLDDAAVADAEEDAEPDAGPPELSPHEREEAAKDALDRARAALADGDIEAARAALDEARRYDPENPDIVDLSRELPEP